MRAYHSLYHSLYHISVGIYKLELKGQVSHLLQPGPQVQYIYTSIIRYVYRIGIY